MPTNPIATLLQPYLQNHKFKVVVPIFLRVVRVVVTQFACGVFSNDQACRSRSMSMSIAWLFFFAQTSSRSYRAFLYSREKRHTNTQNSRICSRDDHLPTDLPFPGLSITVGTCLVDTKFFRVLVVFPTVGALSTGRALRSASWMAMGVSIMAAGWATRIAQRRRITASTALPILPTR